MTINFKVQKALKELKEILEEIKFPIGLNDFDKKVKERSVIVRIRAQKLIDALEDEQEKSRIDPLIKNKK